VPREIFDDLSKNFCARASAIYFTARQKLFSQAGRFAPLANPESIKNERISRK